MVIDLRWTCVGCNTSDAVVDGIKRSFDSWDELLCMIRDCGWPICPECGEDLDHTIRTGDGAASESCLWALYSEQDDVVLFNTEEEAQQAKQRWIAAAADGVRGPFHLLFPELDLLREALNACEDAAYALDRYKKYSEEMRKIGRGLYDSDPRFHRALYAVQKVLKKAGEVVASC